MRWDIYVTKHIYLESKIVVNFSQRTYLCANYNHHIQVLLGGFNSKNKRDMNIFDFSS
jgi:hypothetical protein